MRLVDDGSARTPLVTYRRRPSIRTLCATAFWRGLDSRPHRTRRGRGRRRVRRQVRSCSARHLRALSCYIQLSIKTRRQPRHRSWNSLHPMTRSNTFTQTILGTYRRNADRWDGAMIPVHHIDHKPTAWPSAQS
eukprot:5053920-Pyramimonas_sp.AAC.1